MPADRAHPQTNPDHAFKGNQISNPPIPLTGSNFSS
jgi:hypothetical protein